ncbi:MAG: lipopolysaccharide heptosyltransferase I [Chlamydiota bacterium]
MSRQRRVLIIKLASMGDLVHLLPALTDAKKADPNIIFDWVVDTHFAEVASWHPAVHNIFLTNHRKWRSSLFTKKTRSEFSALMNQLKSNSYDLIIDAQGNLKTALLSLLIQGKTVGFDSSSTPEWGSHFFYGKKVSSSKSLHAISRLRELFAGALDYQLPPTAPDYQIDIDKLTPPSISIPPAYLFFVPIASFSSKLWPDGSWDQLITQATIFNYPIFIPWGNEKERQRALKLSHHTNVLVLPKLSLSEIGYLLLHAKAVISVDTGLSHIAAALSTPCITLYGATDPALTGTLGENQTTLTSSCSCLGKRTCTQPKESFCLLQITPLRVITELHKLLKLSP